MPKGISYTGDFVEGHSKRDACWGYWYSTKLMHIRPQKFHAISIGTKMYFPVILNISQYRGKSTKGKA